jgi:hypothetical protein
MYPSHVRQHSSNVREKVLREKKARQMAEQLARLGIRATMIRATVGGGIQSKEVDRIYEGCTPLEQTERLGRGFAVSRIRASMSPERVQFHAYWAQKVLKLIQDGAHQADAIAAIWRVTATQEGRELHLPNAKGVNAEEFCAVCMNLLTGHVELLQCNVCDGDYIAQSGTRAPCPVCADSHAKHSLRPRVLSLGLEVGKHYRAA